MDEVDADGLERTRFGGCRVAARAHQAQCHEPEPENLAVQGEPVHRAHDAHGPHREEAGHEQNAEANEPDETALRLRGDARERPRLEGGAGTAFEKRGLVREDADSADERDDEQPAGGARDRALPRTRRRTVGRSREEQHGGAADEGDRRREMDPSQRHAEPAHALTRAIDRDERSGLPLAVFAALTERRIVVATVLMMACAVVAHAASSSTSTPDYQGTGVIVAMHAPPSSLHPTRPVVVLHHEPIVGLMDEKMEMPFIAASADLFRGLKPGDRVEFGLKSTDDALLVIYLRPASSVRHR
jgi:Cu/Ag efflux protein CusF